MINILSLGDSKGVPLWSFFWKERLGWLDYNVSQGGLIKAKQEFSLKILVDKKIIGRNFFI